MYILLNHYSRMTGFVRQDFPELNSSARTNGSSMRYLWTRDAAQVLPMVSFYHLSSMGYSNQGVLTKIYRKHKVKSCEGEHHTAPWWWGDQLVLLLVWWYFDVREDHK